MRPPRTFSVIVSAAGGLLAGAAAASVVYRRREPAYQPPSSERLPFGMDNGIAIATRSEALTFARYRRGGGVHLMLVESYSDGTLKGITLHEHDHSKLHDPIALFAALGYAAVENLEGTPVEVLEKDLVVPFQGTSRQIAVGGNYPKHAAETAIAENFLFPKLNAAGGFTDDVPAGTGLLDHEVELGFVSLEGIRRGSTVQYMGLVLASDYTDRATLLQKVDPRKVTSGKGFPLAKSKAGYMPVGNLFVIPKDLTSFYQALQMKLYVDGKLHQDARPGDMVWGPEQMLEQAFRDEGRTWEYEGRQVSLPIEQGTLAPRTIILSGTSDGVILRKPSGRQLALGLFEAALGGFRNVQAAMLEPTIREAQEQRRYLQPGMQVVMRADKLGMIRNRIVSTLERG